MFLTPSPQDEVPGREVVQGEKLRKKRVSGVRGSGGGDEAGTEDLATFLPQDPGQKAGVETSLLLLTSPVPVLNSAKSPLPLR